MILLAFLAGFVIGYLGKAFIGAQIKKLEKKND